MSTLLTDNRSTATTTHTPTATTTTASTTTRPLLLHPQRPPSRNKILYEFAQSQGINSYGSWRFTASDEDDTKQLNNNPYKDSDGSRPGSPISSSSSSERDDRLPDSIGSSGYDRDVLRARASRGSSSLGSSWGISSIGKSIDRAWNASDGTGGTSDADTDPMDDDDDEEDQQRQRQEAQEEQKWQAPLRPTLPTSGSYNNNIPHERPLESPKLVRSIGFHSIGSPLSFPSTTTTPNNIIDLSPYKHHFTSNLNPLSRIAMSVATAPRLDIMIPIDPHSPVNSRPLSPYVSHNVSRAPSSAGSTTSSRFRRRSSQKRISLIAGRVSYSPPPSPPLPDIDADDQQQQQQSPRLLRLNSTSSFASLASTVATAPPTPAASAGAGQAGDYLGERSISEFVIQGDVGRGAYGLVKRGREVMSDGSYGVSSESLPIFFSLGSIGFIASPR